MKKKILSAIGILFSLAILFSACGDDKSSAPSDSRENSEITPTDTTSSANEGSAPTSSTVPASSVPGTMETTIIPEPVARIRST